MSFKLHNYLDGDPTSGKRLDSKLSIIPRVAAVISDRTKKINITIKNNIYCFLVDSGAALSLIKRKIARKYNLTISPTNDVLVDVSGNNLACDGVATVEFKFGFDIIKHRFIVCADNLYLPTDGLIGMDFLENHVVKLDFQRSIFQIQNTALPLINCKEKDDAEDDKNSILQIKNCKEPENEKEIKLLIKRSSNTEQTRVGKHQNRNENALPNVDVKPENADDAHEMSLTLQSKDKATSREYVVRLKTKTHIPARHAAVCSAVVDKRAPLGAYVLEPKEIPLQGVLIARTLIDRTQAYNECTVQIVNTSSEEVTINAKTPLALAVLAEIDDTDPTESDAFPINKVEISSLINDFELDHLNTTKREKIKKFLLDYADIFKTKEILLGKTSLVKHKIYTNTEIPVARAPYRVPFSRRQIMKNLIEEMLENDIITPSTSPWSAPVVLVEKTDPSGETSYRFCIDYRALNAVTKRDFFPIPNLQDTLDQLGKSKRFTTLDLTKGYWQVEVETNDREKTAFSVPWGHYECKRMPFGLVNSPSTWQRLMYTVLSGLTGTHCFVYLDDIICFSSNELDDHLTKLQPIFDRLRNAKLTLNPKKCKFMKTETKYLGHIVSEAGVKPDPSKVSVIQNYPTLTNITEIRAFLGLAGFYRRFIKNFAALAQPLTLLTRKYARFNWNETAQESFDNLRQALITTPILKYPDFDREFILCTDASAFAASAILCQKYDGHELPIAYASRQLRKAANELFCDRKRMCSISLGNKTLPLLFARTIL